MFSDCQNIPILREIWVAESNGVVRVVVGGSEMAVSAHALQKIRAVERLIFLIALIARLIILITR